MAIGATLFDSFASTTAATGGAFSTTNAKSPTQNTVYIVGAVRGSSSVSQTVTSVLTGYGITWTLVQHIFWQSLLRELNVWWGITASPVAPSVLTLTYTGDPDTTGQGVVVFEMSGVDLTIPIMSSAQSFGSGTTRSPTLASYTRQADAALAIFGVSLPTATDVTSKANWTELIDASYESPPTHLQAQFRADAGAANDLGCTAAWDGSSVTSAGAILCLQPLRVGAAYHASVPALLGGVDE